MSGYVAERTSRCIPTPGHITSIDFDDICHLKLLVSGGWMDDLRPALGACFRRRKGDVRCHRAAPCSPTPACVTASICPEPGACSASRAIDDLASTHAPSPRASQRPPLPGDLIEAGVSPSGAGGYTPDKQFRARWGRLPNIHLLYRGWHDRFCKVILQLQKQPRASLAQRGGASTWHHLRGHAAPSCPLRGTGGDLAGRVKTNHPWRAGITPTGDINSTLAGCAGPKAVHLLRERLGYLR